MSRNRRFSNQIDTPDGVKLETLRDAGAYIIHLPQFDRDVLPWQTAMHCLIEAAEKGGPVEFARLGMMQALWPPPAPVYRPHNAEPNGGTTTSW